MKYHLKPESNEMKLFTKEEIFSLVFYTKKSKWLISPFSSYCYINRIVFFPRFARVVFYIPRGFFFLLDFDISIKH